MKTARHTRGVVGKKATRRLTGPRRFTSRKQQALVMAQIQSLQPTIKREARRATFRYNQPYAQGDFESAATEGALRFSRRFDPKRGAKLSTGATQAIRAHIAREAGQQRTVRVPEKALKRVTAAERLPQRVGLEATSTLRDASGGIEQVENRRYLNQLMQHLSPQQQKVVLLSSQGHNHTSIGKKLKITPQRARTMYKRSITKLRAVDKQA